MECREWGVESGEWRVQGRTGQDRPGLVQGLAGMGCSSCRTLVAVARSAVADWETRTPPPPPPPPPAVHTSLHAELFVARLTGGGREGEKYPVLTLLIYFLGLRPGSVTPALSHTDDKVDTIVTLGPIYYIATE